MKKTFVRLLLLLLAFGSPALGQEAYKGQIFVTGKDFSLTGSGLQVSLEVNYEGLKLPSNESLTLTPVLRSKEQSLSLPSIQINGPEMQKAYKRRESLSKNKQSHTPPVSAPSVILQNDKNSARHFNYRVTVPHREWMSGAVLLLRAQECECNGKQAQVYEDLIAGNVSIPTFPAVRLESGVDGNVLALVNFLTPSEQKEQQLAYKGSIPFGGAKNFRGMSEEKQNYEIYYQLRDAVTLIQGQPGTTVSGIRLTGFGSPSGNLHRNERDAAVRALSLKNYLRENRVAGKTPMEVTWVAEDWDSVTSVVSHSDMMFRDAVLDIISTVDVSKGRERMLMNLADGIPYKYLLENVFPTVRRMDYEIQYTREPLDTDESRRLMAAGSRQLSLSEFFAVANSYPKGSAEYNDALDLAARLFPDSPEANINAAAVALSRKDKVRARRYLERFSTLPEAYNNMGILCMMEGNRDKAEVYLEMAAASGVTQAQKALKQLK